MFCQNCGANMPNESKFCHSCGSPIETDGNAVSPRIVQTSEGLKPQEKEALKYEKYVKRSLISFAIYGVIFLLGLSMYITTESWWAHVGCIFLMGLVIFWGLLFGIPVWTFNKGQYEKYKNMSDKEWYDEKERRGNFAKDVTTGLAKGAAQGFIKSLFS